MKEIFSGINNLLRTLAANKGSRIWFILMLLACSGAFYYYLSRTTPVKQDQCDYLIEQNRQLVNALLMIKQDLENVSGKPMSLLNQRISRPSFTLLLISDTVPKKQQDKQIQKINMKIDSVLLKNKKILDSLEKAKSPKKQST
jgi:hypothetical protein